MSVSAYGDLRDCQALPRPTTTSRTAFSDGRDLHDLKLSRWDVELETARPLWRD